MSYGMYSHEGNALVADAVETIKLAIDGTPPDDARMYVNAKLREALRVIAVDSGYSEAMDTAVFEAAFDACLPDHRRAVLEAELIQTGAKIHSLEKRQAEIKAALRKLEN